jgi:phosphoglycolate phosphatase
MFRLIVFDLDGTLVDSRRDLAESVNTLLVERHAEPLAEDSVGRMVGEGAATLVARACRARSVPDGPEALARFLAIYHARLLRYTRPYPDVPDLLSVLARRAALAVLTNKPIGPAREILTGLDLARYFSPNLVLGGDGPLPRKPDPAGLTTLMVTADVAARDTLLVGDSVIDWRTARAAAVPICVAGYGFGFESFPEQEFEELGRADFIINEPTGLLAIV